MAAQAMAWVAMRCVASSFRARTIAWAAGLGSWVVTAQTWRRLPSAWSRIGIRRTPRGTAGAAMPRDQGDAESGADQSHARGPVTDGERHLGLGDAGPGAELG
jgi:hypothetical protein